jgi:hypothetical protein
VDRLPTVLDCRSQQAVTVPLRPFRRHRADEAIEVSSAVCQRLAENAVTLARPIARDQQSQPHNGHAAASPAVVSVSTSSSTISQPCEAA